MKTGFLLTSKILNFTVRLYTDDDSDEWAQEYVSHAYVDSR